MESLINEASDTIRKMNTKIAITKGNNLVNTRTNEMKKYEEKIEDAKLNRLINKKKWRCTLKEAAIRKKSLKPALNAVACI